MKNQLLTKTTKFARRVRVGGQNSGPALGQALKHCFVLNF